MTPPQSVSPGTRARIEALVLGIVASGPILGSAARAAPTWRPVGDTAAIVLRATDVFSRHSPLVGMPTTLSDSVGQAVHHPGPLEFWVIAAGQMVWDHRIAPMLAVAAVNALAVVAVVVMAGWLAGRNGRLVAALVMVLCTWSLRGEILIDPYNPYAAWLPLGAFGVAVVVAASGRLWALPIAVLAGSYAAQAHVSLVVPVAATTMVVLGFAGITALRTGTGSSEVVARARSGVRAQWRPLVAAGIAMALVWSPVALDMVTGRKNLWTLVGAAGSDDPVVGLSRAWDLVSHALVFPPWLTAERSTFELVGPAGGARQLAALALLAIAIIFAGTQLRHRPTLSLLVAVGLAGLGGGMVAASRIPDQVLSIYALHNFLWLWPFTAMLWVGMVACGLASLVDRTAPHRDDQTPPAPVAARGAVIGFQLALALGIVAVAVIGSDGSAARTGLLAPRHGPATGAVADQVAADLPPGSTVVVDVRADLEQSAVSMGLVHELERRGLEALVPPMWEGSFGSHRAHDTEAVDTLLVPLLGSEPVAAPFPDWDLIAAHDPDQAALDELAAANDAIMARIDAADGLVVVDRPRISPESARPMVRRGELLGLVRLDLVISPEIPPATFARYARAQEGPVLYVRVFEASGA
ncbi:MAG: hypothetical protein U5K29_14185 [Acidimicrobiales bacterium]|nr:hypothetical protein [Acidimicrobiales bacterium]